jgi:hypothetical protein
VRRGKTISQRKKDVIRQTGVASDQQEISGRERFINRESSWKQMKKSA